MTKLYSHLPTEDQSVIRTSLQKLKQICFPDAGVMKPTITYTPASQFTQLDGLPYGSLTNGYYIAPSELKDLWQSRAELRDNKVDFITTPKMKWFYNTSNLVGDFYAQDGQKKVSIQFNFWMDAEKVLPIPEVKKAVKDVLTLYSGDTLPTPEQAKACFTPELCRSIYEKNPSKESVGQVVMDLIEDLRKILLKQLVAAHTPQITRKKTFQNWLLADGKRATLAPSQQVQNYLKENKNAVYVLAEEFGYVSYAAKLIRYQELRDSVRHPREVKMMKFNPTTVYTDFAKALNKRITAPSKRAHIGLFADNTELSSHIAQMSEILDILSIYEDKTLKKKNPAYWQDLVQKGVVSASDVPLLQQKIKEYNALAHKNEDANKVRPGIIDDTQILDLNSTIVEAHQQKVFNWLHNQGRGLV